MPTTAPENLALKEGPEAAALGPPVPMAHTLQASVSWLTSVYTSLPGILKALPIFSFPVEAQQSRPLVSIYNTQNHHFDFISI